MVPPSTISIRCNKSIPAFISIHTIAYQRRYKMSVIPQVAQQSCLLPKGNEATSPLSSQEICKLNDTEWDKLTRSDMAGNLLEYLDKLYKDDESESISDWLNEEKFIDLPIFDDFMTNTSPNHVEMKPIEYHKFVPSNKAIQYQPYTPQQFTPMYCQQTNIQQKFNYISAESMTPPASLTPPESPKDTDVLMSMLDDMQPEELTQLVVDDNSLSDFMSSDASSHTDSYSDVVPAKRAKPYSARTPTEEKRLRKKEQNKNAATRYRMKKKAEIKETVMEEKELMQKNDKLKDEAKELAREIKYLKSLLRDVYKAKGLLN
ncbi:activating transcription factor of chaperone [Adelges cooleyi]|uniref:activating transcription factor of chaperone n=1 Tax=Adelges cooleyi TaxID=133065 RepID=UPI00217FDEAA|nr:activating transcription factor of chaperone [Adelges cooleyi]